MQQVASISLEKLREIPYLTRDFDPQRVIPSLNFYVNGEWHLWLLTENQLTKIKAWPVEGNYFGDAPERSTDQRFLFLEVLAQRTLFTDVYRQFHGIWNDFQSLAASLGKMRLFYDAHRDGREVCRYAQTEVEYLILVCRSMFDLLQETVAAHWDRIHISNATGKRQLPKSFADVVLSANELRLAEQIQAKYGLFPAMVEWYTKYAAFFLKLRIMRDRLVHGGNKAVDLLFVTDRGFAISRDLKPFCDLYNWPTEVELPNRLVPLRPVLCTIVKTVRQACDDFGEVLASFVKLPPEMMPGLKFYSRGLHDRELVAVDAVVSQSLWCDAQQDV